MRAVLLLMGILTLSACATKPWVQAYERGYLADPIMSFSRDAISDTYLRHVYEIREAARGAVSGSGGGCGCN